MELDTPTVRALRDRLLEAADVPGAAAGGDGPERPRERRAATERIAPLVEALFLVMVADEEPAPAEQAAIRSAVRILSDGILSAAEVDGLLERLRDGLAREGREGRLEQLASRFALDKQDAEAALSLAAAVALSDGRIAPDEQRLAEDMRRYFGIPRERARRLLGAGVAPP